MRLEEDGSIDDGEWVCGMWGCLGSQIELSISALEHNLNKLKFS
jgi:hypothetical protein